MATIRKIKKITKIGQQFKEDVAKEIKAPSTNVDRNMLVPTGSTTFNLECSGNRHGAFMIGKMVNLIGDSHAGKTLFALTSLAECSITPRFDKYRFIFDDVEAANGFDISYLFGQKTADRIEELQTEPDNTGLKRSKTVEDLNDNLARLYKLGKPFIYIADSFDALTTEAAIDKDEEDRKAREKGNQTTGSYGDGKAKKASSMFSQRIQELADNDSVLIIISQTRDNIGFGAKFTPKTRSGGKALKFYAFHEVWLACQKKEKKGKRVVETQVQAKITKNKLTGRHGEAYFPILFDYGVDNLKSCINFLLDEGDWTGTNGSLNSQGFVPKKLNSKKQEVFRSIAETISFIESHNMEEKLFDLCQETYDTIINGLRPNRKKKY